MTKNLFKINYLIPILCTIIIGISLIISSMILQSAFEQKSSITEVTNESSELKPFITVPEAAEYLGITESELWIIINSNGSTSATLFPAIKIEKTTYVSTLGLVDWLKNVMFEERIYN